MKKVHLIRTAKIISVAILVMIGSLVVPIKGAIAEFTVTPSLQFDVRYANAASETNMQNGITIFYEALEGGRVALQTGEGAEETFGESGYYGAGALADNGYIFIGWVNEDKEYISEEDVYLPLTEDADTKVFAVFEKMDAGTEEEAVTEWPREKKETAAVAMLQEYLNESDTDEEYDNVEEEPKEDTGSEDVTEGDPEDGIYTEYRQNEGEGEGTAEPEGGKALDVISEPVKADIDETSIEESAAMDRSEEDTAGEPAAADGSEEDIEGEAGTADGSKEDIGGEADAADRSEEDTAGEPAAADRSEENIAKEPDIVTEGNDGVTDTAANEVQAQADGTEPKPTAEIAALPAEEVIQVETPEQPEEESEGDRQDKENVTLNVLCVDAASDEVLAEVQQDSVVTGQAITLSDTIKDNYEVDAVGVYAYISGDAYSNKVAPTFYKAQKNVVSIDTATLTSVIDVQPDEDMTVAFYVSPVQTPLADMRLLSNNQIDQPVNTGVHFDWKLPLVLMAWWYGCVTALSKVKRKLPQEKGNCNGTGNESR